MLWDRVLFEEACTTVIDTVQHLPQLKTLHLEPIAEDSMCPEALFTLGKNIQELCILGRQPFLNPCSFHSSLRPGLESEDHSGLPEKEAHSHLFCIHEAGEHRHRRGTDTCRRRRQHVVHVSYCLTVYAPEGRSVSA